jgi:exodeoxyribonuclease VII large subunit
MTKNIYSVGQINSYIKNMFAQDFMLRRIHVRGEVSNCKYHSSGHIYFSLKDSDGVIAAVMFAGNRSRGLKFRMKDGDRVVVRGGIRVYERAGVYQLYAEEIEPAGAGELYRRFEALKRELAEMGMFAPEYKKAIPPFPKTIGVVTAATGAAIRDIQNISHRRNPYVQLILYPAQVQGDGAAASIIRGIHTLEALGVDLMIVGRGGGSMEDLWAFNEEAVARAIFECSIPVISAVGHETDTTIADFVADLRAPTPSAAAELAVWDIREVSDRLEQISRALQQRMRHRMVFFRETLKQRATALTAFSPQYRLENSRQRADEYADRLNERMEHLLSVCRYRLANMAEQLPAAMEQKYTGRRHALSLYASRLEGLSPLRKLSGGYAFLSDSHGSPVHSVEQLTQGSLLTADLTDGRILTEVKKIEKHATGESE